MNLARFSVVVPTFNEASGIASVLSQLCGHLDTLRARYEIELVIVDDGSNDDTPNIVARHCAENAPSVRIVRHERNAGLVAAMRTGAVAARFETIVFLDADLSYRPEIIEKLVRTRLERRAHVVLASPYMPGGYVANVPPIRLLASRVANAILQICAGGRFHTFTGMVRAYDRQTFLALARRDVVGEFNTWAVAALLGDGRLVVEIPADLVWPPRRTSEAPRYPLEALVRRGRLVALSARVLAAAVRSGKRFQTTPGPSPYPVALADPRS